MSVNYIQVQRFSFAYTIYNMRHNLMCPLSTRNIIQRGGLSVRESWEGTEAQGGIASLDHYSKGAVCEWLFGDMCGIKVSGENEFTIAPKAGGKFTFAECEYQSVYGKVSCGWQRENGKVTYKIVIPANTTAKVILPSGEKTLTAGKYEFAEE